jgi:hypothetical protein
MLSALAACLAQGQETPPAAVPDTNTKALENALRGLKLQSDAPVQKTELRRPARAGDGPACGYIRVIPADPATDPKMMIPAPPAGPDGKVAGSAMPVYKGLAPCAAAER